MMCRLGQLLILIAGLILPLAGSASAQAPSAPRTASQMVRGRQSTEPAATTPQKAQTRSRSTAPEAEEEITAIAVIGEVKTPAVFLTKQLNVPLKTLIEKAGGEKANSIGTYRILEYGQAREIISLQRDPQRKITSGQVVLVVPRGGLAARSSSSKTVPARHILIHGLAEIPLILNLEESISSLRDLARSLGQPDENLSRTVVSLPQGGWIDNPDVRMTNGTVVLFDPRIVDKDGIQQAMRRGLTFVPEVSLDPAEKAAAPTAAPPAPLPKTTYDETPSLIPGEIQPTASDDSAAQANDTPPSDAWNPVSPADHPAVPLEAERAIPSGKVPLTWPRGWHVDSAPTEPAEPTTTSGDAASSGESFIERASAQVDGPVVIHTVSAAQIQPGREFPRDTSMSRRNSALDQAPAPPQEIRARPPRTMAPGPNPYWIGFVALFAGIVIGLGVVLARAPRESEPTSLVDEALNKLHTESGTLAPENDPHSLQRLILNRVPIVEEAPELPKSRQLHGSAIGGRRLIVDTAHEPIAGPHFVVPRPGDTRSVELRLRSVMRSLSKTRELVETVRSGLSVDIPSRAALAERQQRVSPLERALRSVDQGEAQ